MSRIRFLQEHEVPQGPGDVVFRQSRWRTGIAFVVIAALTVAFLSSPTLAPYFGWEMKGLVVFAYFGGTFLILFVLFAGTAFRRARQPTNWIMRLAANGIYLRYRSYLNGDFPGEPVALLIPGTDIAYVQPVSEKASEIGARGGKRQVRHWRLEIKLRDEGLDELKEHIVRERKRRIPTRFGSKAIFRHYPVRVLGDDIILVDWRDSRAVTTPSLKAAAAILGRRFPTRAEAERERPDPEQLDRHGQEAEILDLVQAGRTIQAVKLAKRLYGFTTTDAKAFVDDLAS